MDKLKLSIEKNFTTHFFPSFSQEHQKVITNSVIELVEIWIEEHILDEEEAYAKTKAPETVEHYHNVILNVFRQLRGDIK